MNSQNSSNGASFYWTPAENRLVFDMLSRGPKPTSSTSTAVPAPAPVPSSSSNDPHEVPRRNRRKATMPRKIVNEEAVSEDVQDSANNGDQLEIQKNQNLPNKKRRLQAPSDSGSVPEIPRRPAEGPRHQVNPEPFNLQRLLIEEHLQYLSGIPSHQRHQENPEAPILRQLLQNPPGIPQVQHHLNIQNCPLNIQRHQAPLQHRQAPEGRQHNSDPSNSINQNVQIQNKKPRLQGPDHLQQPRRSVQNLRHPAHPGTILQHPGIPLQPFPDPCLLQHGLIQNIPTTSIPVERIQVSEPSTSRNQNFTSPCNFGIRQFQNPIQKLFAHPNFSDFKNLLILTTHQIAHQNPKTSPDDVLKIVVNHPSDLKKHPLFPLWMLGLTSRNLTEMEQHQLRTLISEANNAIWDSGIPGDDSGDAGGSGEAEEAVVASEDRSEDVGQVGQGRRGSEGVEGTIVRAENISEDVRNGREGSEGVEGAIVESEDCSEDVGDSGVADEAIGTSEGFPRAAGNSEDVRNGREASGAVEEAISGAEDHPGAVGDSDDVGEEAGDSGVAEEAVVTSEELPGAFEESEDVGNRRENIGEAEESVVESEELPGAVGDSEGVGEETEDFGVAARAIETSEDLPGAVENFEDVENLTENHQEGRNEEEGGKTSEDVPQPLHASEGPREDSVETSEGAEDIARAVRNSEDFENAAEDSVEDVPQPSDVSEDLEVLEGSEDVQEIAEDSEDHPRASNHLEIASEATQGVSEDVEECPKEKEDSPEIIFLKETPGSIQNSDDVLEITITSEGHSGKPRRSKISGIQFSTILLKDPKIQKAILNVIAKKEAIWKKRDFLDFDEDWEAVGMEVYQMTGAVLSVPQLRLFWKSTATSFSRFLRQLICGPKLIPDPKTVENILNSSDLYHHLKFYRRHLSNYERELWNEVRGDFVDTKILQNIEMCIVNLRDYDLADIKDLDVGNLVDFSTKVYIELD